VCGVTMAESIKDGKSSIWMKLRLSRLRVSTKTLDSTSTDHSTSSPSFHSTECSNAMELTMSGSRDGETMLKLNNGTLIVFQRLSRTTTGSPTHLISKVMVVQLTLDAQPPTQDGGKSSDMKADSSSTRKERLLKFKIRTSTQMLKTETSRLPTEVLISDNNSRLFTLINTLSQRKVS